MNHIELIERHCYNQKNLNPREKVLVKRDVEIIISKVILDTIEQIEDCHLSKLGDLLEQLKEEFSQ